MQNRTSFYTSHCLLDACKHLWVDVNDIPLCLSFGGGCEILKSTVHVQGSFVTCATIQQLHSCNACVIASHGYVRADDNIIYPMKHHSVKMWLVSYDTVVCTYEMLPLGNGYSWIVTFNENTMYSRTTVQHVYKFLKECGLSALCVKDAIETCKQDTHNMFRWVNRFGKSGLVVYDNQPYTHYNCAYVLLHRLRNEFELNAI